MNGAGYTSKRIHLSETEYAFARQALWLLQKLTDKPAMTRGYRLDRPTQRPWFDLWSLLGWVTTIDDRWIITHKGRAWLSNPSPTVEV